MGFLRRTARLPKRLKITYSLIVLVVITGISVFIWATLTGKIKPFAAAGEAALNLSPGLSYELGQTFGAPINVDTSGVEVSDIAVRSLHYNSSVLEVIDSDSSTAGIQIAGDSLGGLQSLENSVDPAAGRITYEIKIPDTNTPGFTGSARVALISFRAIQAGRADFSFDFTAGQTGDTDVIAKETGNDILVSAPATFLTITSSGGETPPPGGSSPTPRPSASCVKGCSPTPVPQPSSTPTEIQMPEESPSPVELNVSQTLTPATIAEASPQPSPSPLESPLELLTSPSEMITSETSPPTKLFAGFAISRTAALLLYIGVPVVVVVTVFFIWWWWRKKKISEDERDKKSDEIDDDEMI